MLKRATTTDVMNRLGRAMADPTRARILMMMLDGPTYPAMLSEELELSRSNVSNHLTCLRGCGLVVAAAEGRRVRYELADPQLARAISALLHVVIAIDDERACPDVATLLDTPHEVAP